MASKQIRRDMKITYFSGGWCRIYEKLWVYDLHKDEIKKIHDFVNKNFYEERNKKIEKKETSNEG